MVTNYRGNKKEGPRHLIFPIFFGILIFLVIGFLVVSNWKIYQRRSGLNTQIETLKKKIQVLEERHKDLEAQISQTTNEEYLEKEARERFNLKKPDEEVVAILPPEEETSQKREERIWLAPLKTLLEKIF